MSGPIQPTLTTMTVDSTATDVIGATIFQPINQHDPGDPTLSGVDLRTDASGAKSTCWRKRVLIVRVDHVTFASSFGGPPRARIWGACTPSANR